MVDALCLLLSCAFWQSPPGQDWLKGFYKSTSSFYINLGRQIFEFDRQKLKDFMNGRHSTKSGWSIIPEYTANICQSHAITAEIQRRKNDQRHSPNVPDRNSFPDQISACVS